MDGGPLDSSLNETNLVNGIHKIGQKLPNNRELGTQENKAVMPPRASTTPELKMSRNRTISEKAEENDKVYHTQQHVFRCTPCLTDKCVMCCRKLLLYVFYTAGFLRLAVDVKPFHVANCHFRAIRVSVNFLLLAIFSAFSSCYT